VQSVTCERAVGSCRDALVPAVGADVGDERLCGPIPVLEITNGEGKTLAVG
jgi:hypothetical protein